MPQHAELHINRKTKIYEFLSRSTSRSRSKSTRRSSKSSTQPESDLTTTTTTTTTTDAITTIDSHLSPSHQDRSKPLTRSPSRPLSSNTSGTASTITPLNAPIRARTPRAHHSSAVMHLPAQPQDSAPPPPPPPGLQSRRKFKPTAILGVSLRSRPTSPDDGRSGNVSLPRNLARGRSGWESSSYRHSRDATTINTQGPSGSMSSAFLHSPRPRLAAQGIRDDVHNNPRSRSSPPQDTISASRPPSGLSSRGRCSPFFNIRLFSRSGSRGGSASRSISRKGKERATEKERPQVSVPIISRRLSTRDNGHQPAVTSASGGFMGTAYSPRHASFDFERIHSGTHPGLAGIGSGEGLPEPHSVTVDVKRSISQGKADNRKRTSHQSNMTHHTHSQSMSGRAELLSHRVHNRTPIDRQERPLAARSPTPMDHSTRSQSTATTATGVGTNERRTRGSLPNGDGSWGRRARTAGWVRAGVHPPFAFEHAMSGSGTSNGRASPAGTSDGRGQASLESRRSGRSRDASQAQSDAGQWNEREIELGLGLTWAPSKIRMREFTGLREGRREDNNARRSGREHEPEKERVHLALEGRRHACEQLEEFGYLSRRRKADKEVTNRFKIVLGEQGFETFKKYVRRFDAEIIPLEGASGLLVHVRRLLDSSPVSEREKREMLDDLVRIVRENEW